MKPAQPTAGAPAQTPDPDAADAQPQQPQATDPMQELMLQMQPYLQGLPPQQRKQMTNVMLTEFTKQQVQKYSSGAGPNFDVFNLDPSVKESISRLPRDKQVSLFTDLAKNSTKGDAKVNRFSNKVRAAEALLDQLEEMRERILANGIKLGPGAGQLAQLGGEMVNDPALGEVAAYNDLRMSTAGLYAEVLAGEAGKKTEDDIKRALSTIPSLDRTESRYTANMREARRTMQTYREGGNKKGGTLAERRMARANQILEQNPDMDRNAIMEQVKKEITA